VELHNGDHIAPSTRASVQFSGRPSMNDATNRYTRGTGLGARLDSACCERRRLSAEQREAIERRTVDALNQISFTRADGLDVTYPLTGRTIG